MGGEPTYGSVRLMTTHLRAAWPRFRAILRDRQMTRLSALSIRTFEGCSEVVVEP